MSVRKSNNSYLVIQRAKLPFVATDSYDLFYHYFLSRSSMFKTPANEDSAQSPSHLQPHECNIHHRDLEYSGTDKDLGAAHHTLRSHHPVPVPVSNHSDSTPQGKIAGKQAKGSTEVGRGNEKLSHEEQEQCKTRGGLGVEDDEFPEGGIKAWSVVLGSFCALFSALGIINSIGMSEKQR